MGKIPHFPFYPDDWIASRKRISLSYRQQGIYMLLLAHSWRKPLPKDRDSLMVLVPRSRWSDVEKVLMICFRETREGHMNDKQETLRERAMDISNKASYAGKCSANKKKQSTSVERPRNVRTTNHNQNHNHKDNIYTRSAKTAETGARFNTVWEKYPNKDGKKEALRHFTASVKTEQDLSDINTALENYIKHLSVNTWKKPKSGSTWFNNWRDWIKWVEPEHTGGDEMKKRTAQEELLLALKNQNNKVMPFLDSEAKILFYSLKKPWRKLQEEVISGVDIFAAPETDKKSAAAGEK